MRIEKTYAVFTTFARSILFYFLEVKTNGWKRLTFRPNLGHYKA